ncbi:hypothetical protein ACHAXR_004354, partial [Thalassiosira sp. AJA248-18]
TSEEESAAAAEAGAVPPSKTTKKKKKNSVGDRVAAVMAAAEEIRNKKKGARAITPESHVTDMTPATEPGSQKGDGTQQQKEQSAAGALVAAAAQKQTQAVSAPKKQSEGGDGAAVPDVAKSGSKTSSKSPTKKPTGKNTAGRKSPGTKTGGRKSPGPKTATKKTNMPGGLPPTHPSQQQPKQQTNKKKKRPKTPEFSPEIKSHSSVKEAAMAAAAASPNEDDNRTHDTKSITDGSGASTNPYDDDTLGTDGMMSFEENCADGVRRCTLSMSAEDESERNDGDSMTYDEDGEAYLDADGGDPLGQTKKVVMNKDIITHGAGGPSSLVVRAMYYTPLPASPDDIIIKVEASTVTFRDCLLRRDMGPDKATFPFVPGCEVVGTISNIGKAARLEGYRVGDRVVGLARRGGGNGYYAKFSTSTVAPVLSTAIDAADAVCLVDVYMTAYQALRVGKKDGTPLTEANVLITDGFSPVGQAAVQLAKLEGANVYVTLTEKRQDEYMKTLGVKCLPLAPSKWLHKLKGKMDIVIDNTCFDSYDSSWKALNPAGVLVCTGMTSLYSFKDMDSAGMGGSMCACDAFGAIQDYQAKWAALKARYMMSQTKFHDLWESFQKDPKKYQQELKYLCFLVESGSLKPKIAERVSIEEVPDAQRYLETGKVNGTIVCLP